MEEKDTGHCSLGRLQFFLSFFRQFYKQYYFAQAYLIEKKKFDKTISSFFPFFPLCCQAQLRLLARDLKKKAPPALPPPLPHGSSTTCATDIPMHSATPRDPPRTRVAPWDLLISPRPDRLSADHQYRLSTICMSSHG